MKTIEDLRELYSTILRLISAENHNIGDSYMEQDEDGWGRTCDYGRNIFVYEEDGWFIEVTYQCCGEWESYYGDDWNPPYCDLIRGWGEVTEITASHYDEESGDETEFSDEDLEELWSEIDEELKDIS